MSDSLWPHYCSKPAFPVLHYLPEFAQFSCPLSQWCHPTISSSVVPLSSCLQSFPASGSFPMSQLFASDGQSIGTSASASVLSMNIQGWFPLGLTDCRYWKSVKIELGWLQGRECYLISCRYVTCNHCLSRKEGRHSQWFCSPLKSKTKPFSYIQLFI